MATKEKQRCRNTVMSSIVAAATCAADGFIITKTAFKLAPAAGKNRLTADPSLKELLFFLDTTSRFCTMEPSMPVLATKDDGWIFWSVTALVAMATVLFYFL